MKQLIRSTLRGSWESRRAKAGNVVPAGGNRQSSALSGAIAVEHCPLFTRFPIGSRRFPTVARSMAGPTNAAIFTMILSKLWNQQCDSFPSEQRTGFDPSSRTLKRSCPQSPRPSKPPSGGARAGAGAT